MAGRDVPHLVRYIMAESEVLAFTNADPAGPWQAFVMRQIVRAVNEGKLTSFVGGLRDEAWMLADACVKFQVGLIERAVLRDREAFITALFDLDAAVLRRRVPPPSQAIKFAFTYAKTHLVPTLLRIWRLPNDLPHAAGNGDFARVKSWFDAEGKPALGDLANHFSANSVHRGNLNGANPVCSRFSTPRSPGRSSTTTSRSPTFFSVTGRISTRTGVPMSPPASCMSWCFTKITKPCNSSSTAAST
jgi:hypothetical protein